MKRLADLSARELAEETRKWAQEVQESDARLGDVLSGLLANVDELARRLDADE